MAKPAIQGTFTVMHYATEANFDDFVYGAYQIVENTSAPFTINGTTITSPVAAQLEGQIVPLMIDGDTTTPNADLLFYGNPIAPQTQVKTGLISATTETFQNNTGRVDTYQYIDIKTGNPIRS
tara:strand:- start:3041 stop:3409 length:369 start_codon:yes stop_codon:yes gene_type:complete